MGKEQDVLEMAKRMLKAFKSFECFVFEREELELVKKTLIETKIRRLVRIKKADPKYEHILIVVPWSKEFENMCLAKVKELLAQGRIDRDTYNKRYNELVLQCIRHYERERVKEIINILQNYIEKATSGGNIGGKAKFIPFEFT